MPFKYERDDIRYRVVITFEGPFQLREGLASVERHRVEDAWSFGILYDLRHMTGSPVFPTSSSL